MKKEEQLYIRKKNKYAALKLGPALILKVVVVFFVGRGAILIKAMKIIENHEQLMKQLRNNDEQLRNIYEKRMEIIKKKHSREPGGSLWIPVADPSAGSDTASIQVSPISVCLY